MYVNVTKSCLAMHVRGGVYGFGHYPQPKPYKLRNVFDGTFLACYSNNAPYAQTVNVVILSYKYHYRQVRESTLVGYIIFIFIEINIV